MATMRAATADEQRRSLLRFLALTPNAKLSAVVRGCRMSRREASRCLDQLIVEGLVRVKRPWLGRLGLMAFGPLLSLLVGAERYRLTDEGLWLVARDDSSEP